WPSERNRARAAAFALAAVLLVIGAVSCDPVRVSNVPESVPTAPATIQESPTLTPMTKAPELTNREEVARALVAYYPPLVRDAGNGGTATVNMFIDTEGTVQRVMLGRSSGYPSLDEAALAVAGRMKWTPALLHDGTVAVWVEIPIEFNADNPADGAPSPSRARVLREERRERSDQPVESRPRTSSESQARFTPFDVGPEMTNRDEVQSVLVRNYPPLLRDAGIGGTADVRIHVGVEGTVQQAE